MLSRDIIFAQPAADDLRIHMAASTPMASPEIEMREGVSPAAVHELALSANRRAARRDECESPTACGDQRAPAAVEPATAADPVAVEEAAQVTAPLPIDETAAGDADGGAAGAARVAEAEAEPAQPAVAAIKLRGQELTINYFGVADNDAYLGASGVGPASGGPCGLPNRPSCSSRPRSSSTHRARL